MPDADFGDPTGAPLPPARLRVLVSGDPDPQFFVLSGWAHNCLIRKLMSTNGVDPEQPMKVLDLACGCGRITRWWGDLERAEIHGCDYNPELVAWADEHLPYYAITRNGKRPPLPYAEGSFDLLYAFSFFTHLDNEGERAWARELQRVVKPGGLVVLTTMGEKYADHLSAEELAAFRAGRPVVHFGESEGSNLCAAYHPTEHVESTILDGFEVLDRILAVEEETYRTSLALSQDVYLARRSEAEPSQSSAKPSMSIE